MQDLHDLNVCHCDITPDNVLVDDEGNITLIDFHLAKLTSSSTMQRYDLDAIDEYL